MPQYIFGIDIRRPIRTQGLSTFYPAQTARNF